MELVAVLLERVLRHWAAAATTALSGNFGDPSASNAASYTAAKAPYSQSPGTSHHAGGD